MPGTLDERNTTIENNYENGLLNSHSSEITTTQEIL